MEYFVDDGNITYVVETVRRDISEEIIGKLVESRKSKGLTQQDISDLTGMARANIARFESCRSTPSLDVLIKYATAMNLRLSFELEEIEEQRPGKNKRTLINSNYIDGGEFRRKFDRITDSPKLNRLIYDKAKEMLKHRSGTEYEDMYWFDATAGEVLCKKSDELVKGEVRHTKAIDTKIKKCGKVIAMHTHPHSMPPCPADFNCYVEAGYALGIVVCHNGDVYLYRAVREVNTRLWERYVEREKLFGFSETDAQRNALNSLQANGDIEFTEVEA